MATNTFSREMTTKQKKQLVFFFMLTPIVILLGFFFESFRDIAYFVSMWNAIFGLALPILLLLGGRAKSPMHIVFLSGMSSFAIEVYMISSKWYTPNEYFSAASFALAVLTVLVGIIYIRSRR